MEDRRRGGETRNGGEGSPGGGRGAGDGLRLREQQVDRKAKALYVCALTGVGLGGDSLVLRAQILSSGGG